MTSTHRRRWYLSLAIVLLLWPSRIPASQPDTFTKVDRIVAVGDVHGGYDEFVAILRQARIIDGRNHWVGGRSHLVQTGDLVDRAAGSRKVMDLMLRLEREARRAGGRVHALLGNHEVMNVTGDLRYTSPGEFASYATASSEQVRHRAYLAQADPARRDDPAYREAWYAAHPLGWIEHRRAFSASGRYGQWIRRRLAIVRIGNYLFLHGGVDPSLEPGSIGEINARIAAELRGADVPKNGLAAGRAGPLWFRGLANEPEEQLGGRIDALLARFGVSHIVVGHTTMPGAIVPRLDAKVILIDVGLSAHYGARPACLVIERGVPRALHRGRPLALPDGSPGSLVAYLQAAEALDPRPSPLRPLIENGGRLPLPDRAEGEAPTKKDR